MSLFPLQILSIISLSCTFAPGAPGRSVLAVCPDFLSQHLFSTHHYIPPSLPYFKAKVKVELCEVSFPHSGNWCSATQGFQGTCLKHDNSGHQSDSLLLWGANFYPHSCCIPFWGPSNTPARVPATSPTCLLTSPVLIHLLLVRWCLLWTELCPPNLYHESPTPIAMALGGGAFGR